MNLKSLAKKANAEYSKAHSLAENAISHIVNCGEYLIQAKAKVNGEWTVWAAENLEFNAPQAAKYIRIATHKVQALQLVKAEGDMSIDSITAALPRTAEDPVVTEADAQSIVGQTGSTGRNADDWQTPIEYIEAARAMMGSIDLDPFSSVRANTDIKAARIFTEADDGLEQSWASKGTRNVWMNPPYGRGMVNKAIDKFLAEYENGSFKQAVVLMNAATDTHWFHDMCRYADSICLTEGRISFISGDKKLSQNTKGQVFFYFGSRPADFKRDFIKYGLVVSVEEYL